MSEEGIILFFCLYLPALAVVAFVLWRTRRQVAKLTAQLAEQQTLLTGLLQRLESTPPAESIQPAIAEANDDVAASTPPPAALPTVDKAVALPAPAQPLSSLVEVVRVAPSPAPAQDAPDKPSIFQPFFDWFLGMAIVVRVGIVLLFIGVAFLFSYAVDRGWLSVEVRLAGAALLGGLLIAVGWRLRHRQPVYALTLQGGGYGIAYMTVFAAFRLFDLLPGLPAFLLLLGLVILCMALAVLNDSRALAVLAIGGGFLAPVLASTGAGSHITLFGYFLVLNLGILGVAWFKAWRGLNLLGFVFTFVLGFAWGAEFYQPAYFPTVEPFLVVFFLFYVAIAILFTRRQPPRLLGFVDGPLIFGTPAVALALQSPLTADYPYGLAWSAAAAGLLYLLLAGALRRTGEPNYRGLVQVFLPLGTILLSLAVPLAFANDTTTYLWAIEGAALVWLGLRQKQRFYQFFGPLLQVAAGVALLFYMADTIFDTGEPPPILNAYYFGALAIALSALASGWFFLSHQRAQAERDRDILHGWLHWLLTGYGLLWWYLGGLLEAVIITQLYDPQYLLAGALAFVALSCLAGEVVGSRLAWQGIRLPWLALWLITGLVYLGGLVVGDPPFAYGGWYAFPLALAVHFWILHRWDGDGWQRLYHAAGLWLIGLVGTAEIGMRVGSFTANTELADPFTLPASLWPLCFVLLMAGVVWVGQGVAWPTARHYRFYVGPLLVLPALILAGWSFDVNARFSGATGSLPYLPVLNPLGLANLFVLGLLLLWLQHLKRLEFPLQPVKAARLGVIFLIFFWLNVEMARTVHHWQAVPYRFENLFDTPLLQAAYAIVWGVLALVLMFGATRRGVRWVWLLGGALLALTVLKLFFVDLAGTGTVARIVSFIGVGLLMTVIGYFAPAPPATDAE